MRLRGEVGNQLPIWQVGPTGLQYTSDLNIRRGRTEDLKKTHTEGRKKRLSWSEQEEDLESTKIRMEELKKIKTEGWKKRTEYHGQKQMKNGISVS